MPKFLKPGKVVIVLKGKHAGKKAVIVKEFDNGTKQRPYPHAVLAGVDKAPKRVKKTMSRKKVAKQSRVFPFLKVVNYQHVMPTRYSFSEPDWKNLVAKKAATDPSQKRQSLRRLRAEFQNRYKAGQKKWFFSKLRF
mmetsp:Transcript_18694/g.32391  ORF Transcript_18694/g.32391 Transcript_18694/m.32391 type:complete len:137 (-) Transcript_18694:81-491(-)|eukprot:CAMPEP_0168590158 /NCGR_PEP_ID=MMETSP0420-20121227/6409_1 /TAXON_ID=498008 /ORGANISM="Pessonella sp." /LENGTH=136 /DNA_ID=CAMNT_0008625779 /DNA_START=45 /DNA_END=455 /DNA_ORIENTATION=+